MDFFDFFMPQQAQASHLRALSRSQMRTNASSRASRGEHRQRLEELESDVGTLALILGSLMRKMDEKGVLSRADMKSAIEELDDVDGDSDGKLDMGVLRGMTK